MPLKKSAVTIPQNNAERRIHASRERSTAESTRYVTCHELNNHNKNRKSQSTTQDDLRRSNQILHTHRSPKPQEITEHISMNLFPAVYPLASNSAFCFFTILDFGPCPSGRASTAERTAVCDIQRHRGQLQQGLTQPSPRSLCKRDTERGLT